MKKFIALLFILLLAACSAAQPDVETAVPTETLAPTVTNTAVLTPTFDMEAMPIETQQDYSYIEKRYDPTEWEHLLDEYMVWDIGITSTQEIYLGLHTGEIAYLLDDTWELFSLDDLGLQEGPHDMVVAPDDSIWIANRSVASHYVDNQWKTYSMPDISDTSFIRLAVDSNGVLWVSQHLCYCENSMMRFDGNSWAYLPDENFALSQLLFTPDGTLCGTLGGAGILTYDGESWEFDYGEDLWSSSVGFPVFRIAADESGKVYAVSDMGDSVVVWNNDRSIESIPYDSSFYLNGFLIRIFVDSQETIWMNACLENDTNSCLVFYKDAQWYKFINLPFSTVADIKELANGEYLVATEKGLFKYQPGN